MTVGSGQGNYYLQLLKHWNVKRVSMVIQGDYGFTAYGNDIYKTLADAGLTILTKIILTSGMLDTGDFELAYHILKAVDTRYIIIVADADVTARFYYPSKKHSLIGPSYVWIAGSAPMPYDGDLLKNFGKGAIDDMEGFIFLATRPPDINSEPVQAYNASWKALQAANPNNTRYADGYSDFSDVGSFDCVKLLMIGMHQFLEAHPQYTPEMLANGSLNQFLTPDKFANTGYRGVTVDPMTLNQNGDLNIGVMYSSLNYTMYMTLIIDDTLSFGTTNEAATEYIALTALPVFNGGTDS
ncbi:hypothetical protein HDU76_002411, partial [Blyttiomyces sp. JEL0837]